MLFIGQRARAENVKKSHTHTPPSLMLSSDTRLGCNGVCCVGESCNYPLGRYANTDGETFQVTDRASAVAQLRVVVLQERAKAHPTGTVF